MVEPPRSKTADTAGAESARGSGRPVVDVKLLGHLTSDALASELATATRLLCASSGTVNLIVDCTRMTGYDLGARGVFVEWNRANRGRVRRVAILTSNSLWRMVISVMSLAATVEMKPFEDRDEAMKWL